MAGQNQWKTKVVTAWNGIVEDVAWHIWWHGILWCSNDDITKVVMAWHSWGCGMTHMMTWNMMDTYDDMEYDGVLMMMSQKFIYNKFNGWDGHGW